MRSTVFRAVVILAISFIAAANLNAQEYRGSSYCLICHSSPQGEHPAVGDMVLTYHNTSLRDPEETSASGPPGVVTHDQWVAGLDLATTSNFAKYGENAPKLSYDDSDPKDSTDYSSGYKLTIGAVTYPVNVTYGGHGKWKQRYMTQIGESIYILPTQWNEKSGEWVTYHAEHWYDENNLPLYTDETTLTADVVKKNSFERRCQGCHSTGLQLAYDETNGYVNTYSELNTLCERCHGAGGPAVSPHSGTGLLIGDLTQDQRLELCGQCHSRGSSVGTAGGNTFDFPVNADLEPYNIGNPLSDYFNLVSLETSASKFWPDGHSQSHHQQMIDFKRSHHYGNSMDCTSCHDLHQAPGDHQVRDQIEVTGADSNPLSITTSNDDNTLCLACHAAIEGPFSAITKEMVADAAANNEAIGAVVSLHTNHAYDPDGSGESRCSKCHMPKTMKSAIPHDIHSHTFEVILPEKTLNMTYQNQGGMPNSCALSCHNKSNPWNITDLDNSVWNESTDIELAAELNQYAVQWWGEEIAQNCDFNGDGKLSISDAIAFLLLGLSDPVDQRLDRNSDGKYDLNDIIALLNDIWNGTCSEVAVYATLLASTPGDVLVEKVDGLSVEQIEYIETILKKLDLTPEQEAAFRIALYGQPGKASLPKAFALSQNAPNPFNPATTISYSVPEGAAATVDMKVYDIRGQLVRTLVNESKEAGSYTVFWDGTDESGRKVSSGVYFYRMRAGKFVQTRKMVLLK